MDYGDNGMGRREAGPGAAMPVMRHSSKLRGTGEGTRMVRGVGGGRGVHSRVSTGSEYLEPLDETT